MSEGPIPNSWKEAIPVVIWVVLVLAFGFLFADSLGQLFKNPLWRAVFAFITMAVLLAVLIYRKWLLERFRTLFGASVLAAIIAVMLTLALSPPFAAWFRPAPTGDQAVDKVVTDVDPEFLMDLYAGKTKVQGDAAVLPYLGKWIKIHAAVTDVSRLNSGAALIYYSYGVPKLRDIAMWFDGRDAETVSTYPIGHPVDALCRIDKIDLRGLVLQLCSLIERNK